MRWWLCGVMASLLIAAESAIFHDPVAPWLAAAFMFALGHGVRLYGERR